MRAISECVVVTFVYLAGSLLGCGGAGGSAGGGAASAGPAPTSAGAVTPGVCRPSAPTGASFEVVVLGSGGPVPGRRACASHAVMIDGVARVLVDVGPGAAVRIGEAEIDTRALDIVLLTHLHVDHAGDLPGFVKARDLANDGPLSFFIAGPEGRGEYPPSHALVEGMLGPRGQFAYLAGFKNALDIGGRDLSIDRSTTRTMDVLERPGLRITAVATDHGDAPAVAYRIEHAGHSVVFGGDTTLAGDGVSKLAAGADLLIANATVRDPPNAPAALYRLHAAPSRIGAVAQEARVGAVVLAHLPLSVTEHEPEVVASVRSVYRGPVTFASDCRRFRADGVAAR